MKEHLRQMPDRGIDTELESWNLAKLSELRVGRGILNLLFDWSVILVAVGASCQIGGSLTYLIAVVVVASRQNAMFVSMHEASHWRLCRGSWWNDVLGNVLAAWPLLLSTQGYREHHFRHHRFLNTDNDPDWVRKKNLEDWQFPKSKGQVVKILAPYFLGKGLVDLIGFVRFLSFGCRGQWSGRDQVRWSLAGSVFIVAIPLLFAVYGLGSILVYYWIIPLIFLYPLLIRVRSIAEHFGTPGGHSLGQSRNIFGTWWERFLFAPHGVNYHLVHHLYPSIPVYNLKAAHDLMMQNDSYRDKAFFSKTYFTKNPRSLLSDLTNV